jgi:hypothetical protein
MTYKEKYIELMKERLAFYESIKQNLSRHEGFFETMYESEKRKEIIWDKILILQNPEAHTPQEVTEALASMIKDVKRSARIKSLIQIIIGEKNG